MDRRGNRRKSEYIVLTSALLTDTQFSRFDDRSLDEKMDLHKCSHCKYLAKL